MKSCVSAHTLIPLGLAALFVAALTPAADGAPPRPDPIYKHDPYGYNSTYCPPACTDVYDSRCKPPGDDGTPPGDDGTPPDDDDNGTPPDDDDDGTPPDNPSNRTCTPERLRVRKEIRSLTPEELNRFFSALRQLHQGSAPTDFDDFNPVHIIAWDRVHFGVAPFFPFHRKYIYEFETALRRYEPQVTMPYWDWTLDASTPHLSPVFGPTYFGGNGGPDRCVTDGAFTPWNVRYNSPHCLQRSFNMGSSMSPFSSRSVIDGLMAATSNFQVFSQSIEGPPHAIPHNNIGGDMSLMISPNEPLFWLHHCFVDKIWYDWQAMDAGRAAAYGGSNFGGTPASVNDPIPEYEDTTIADVLNSEGDALCVRYEGRGPPAPSPVAAPRFINPNSDDAETNGTEADFDGGLPSLDMSDLFGPDAQLPQSPPETANRRLIAPPPSGDDAGEEVFDDSDCPIPAPLTDEIVQRFGLDPVAIRIQEARIADFMRARCAQGLE